MLYLIGGIAVVLTVFMFTTRQSMLGFPSSLFWLIFCGYCYQQSVTTWDMYYIIFFASFGMTIFSMYAAFVLREKPDATEIDEKSESETEDNRSYTTKLIEFRKRRRTLRD